MNFENKEIIPGIEQLLTYFPRPYIVDIGGGNYHANTFKDTGELGTLICAHPDNIQVRVDDNILYIPGGYEGVGLPAGTADEVQLNMIVTYVLGQKTFSPFDVVMETIETARKFAKPGVWLEMLDMNPTTEQVARQLQKKGFTIQHRALDSEHDQDRSFCNARSYDASMHWDVGLEFLRIQL